MLKLFLFIWICGEAFLLLQSRENAMFPCIGKLYTSKVPMILSMATGVGSMSSSLIAGLANTVRSSIDVAAMSLVCAFCAKKMTLW